jgi:DNA-binding MarR family transcriptional regulator
MPIELLNDDLTACSILSAGLRPFREIDNMQLSEVATILAVAAKDGERSASDMSKLADISMPKARRRIAEAKALGLIDQRPDDFDQRTLRCYLTERGRGLVRSVAENMRRRAAVRAAA